LPRLDHHIEDDQVGPLRLDLRHPFRSGGCRKHIVPGMLKDDLQRATQIDIIVNDQNPLSLRAFTSWEPGVDTATSEHPGTHALAALRNRS
jgi:hypothetical protein